MHLVLFMQVTKYKLHLESYILPAFPAVQEEGLIISCSPEPCSCSSPIAHGFFIHAAPTTRNIGFAEVKGGGAPPSWVSLRLIVEDLCSRLLLLLNSYNYISG